MPRAPQNVNNQVSITYSDYELSMQRCNAGTARISAHIQKTTKEATTYCTEQEVMYPKNVFSMEVGEVGGMQSTV